MNTHNPTWLIESIGWSEDVVEVVSKTLVLTSSLPETVSQHADNARLGTQRVQHLRIKLLALVLSSARVNIDLLALVLSSTRVYIDLLALVLSSTRVYIDLLALRSL